MTLTGETAVKETLRELDALSKQREQELTKRRREGQPVIAYSGTYIPEEIIRAAGAETYYLCRGGESVSGLQILNSCLRFMNPLSRAMAEYALFSQTDPALPGWNLLVLQQTDCHTARAGEYLSFEGVPMYMTGVPSDWGNPASFEYYLGSLRKMTARVEEITGRAVDRKQAEDNFAKTNRINALFRKLGTLRKADDPPFSFCDWMRLQHASFMVDYDLMTEKLERLCRRLERQAGVDADAADDVKGQAAKTERQGQPRILLAGRAVAPGDYTVPAVIEECGAVIAAELLDEAIRVYDRDVEAGEDLLRQFARNRYLDSRPANFMQSSWERRCAHIMDLIEEYRIDAVVWYQLSFDEIYDMEFSFLSGQLGKKRIPIMKLESSYDYSGASLGMLMTRAESFVEAVRQHLSQRTSSF